MTEPAPAGSTLTRVGPSVVVVVAVLALTLAPFLPLVAAPIAAGALVVAIIGWRQDWQAFTWALVASIAAVAYSLIFLGGTLVSPVGGSDELQPVREPGPVVNAPLP